MNTRELRELVAEGESDHLEFKKSTGQRTEAAKTVCAMLNGLGGFVLFGVTDKGEVIGQLVAANTLEDIATGLRRIEPPAFPDIIDWCTENANPKPTWHEQAGSVYVTFLSAALPAVQRATRKDGATAVARHREVAGEVTSEVTGEVTGEVRQLLRVMKTAMSRSEIQRALSLKGQANFRNRYLLPALRNGLIEMTIPGKPNSRMQEYRLTARGRDLLSRR